MIISIFIHFHFLTNAAKVFEREYLLFITFFLQISASLHGLQRFFYVKNKTSNSIFKQVSFRYKE